MPVGKLHRDEPPKEQPGTLSRIAEASSRIAHGVGQAVDKGMDGAIESTGKAWDAIRSKEVRDGVEFGARAAWEVSKDVEKIVGKDVAMASIGVPLPTSSSIAIDKLYKLVSIDTGFHSDYKQQAKDLARRIAQQKRNVYSPTEKQDAFSSSIQKHSSCHPCLCVSRGQLVHCSPFAEGIYGHHQLSWISQNCALAEDRNQTSLCPAVSAGNIKSWR